MPENDDKLNGELYNALLKEEMENVINLCERVPDHAMHAVAIHNDTVLHLATYSKQAELVLRLLQVLPHHLIEKMTTRKNVTGNTVLHEAATLDDRSVEIATKMLEKAPELLNICNELGESVLFQAARYGKTQIFNFLADIFSKYDEAKQKLFSQRTDKTTMLHIAILARHFGKFPPAHIQLLDVHDCIYVIYYYFFLLCIDLVRVFAMHKTHNKIWL